MIKNIIENPKEEIKKSLSPLKSSKKQTCDKLSYTLKYAKKDSEEEISEKGIKNAEANFLNYMKQQLQQWIRYTIKWVQDITGEPLTKAQANYLWDIIAQNFIKNTLRFKRLIDFFSKHKNLGASFYEVIELFELNLTIDNLENLATLEEEYICSIEEFIKFVGNVEVLWDNITDKLTTLKDISLHKEDEWNWSLDLDREDFILLKKVKLSEELIEKINYLLANNVNITIKDIIKIDKKWIDEPTKEKINQIKDTVILHGCFMPQLKKQKISEQLLENLTAIKKLDIQVYIPNLKDVSKLNLSEQDIKKIEYVMKLSEHTFDYRVEDIYFIQSLTLEEIKKIYDDAKKLGLKWLSKLVLIALHNIPEELLKYCIENNINDTTDILKVRAMYSISDRKSLKEYIERKNKYLEDNKLLSDEKYNEYFWWKWKYNKHEIYQWNLWLCYLYSWLEILKKMNGFNALIQTNFKEVEDWRMVRYPFTTWKWVKVNEEEIDKIYEIPLKNKEIRKVNINSIWDYKWFKILEIAYIKNKLLWTKYWWKKWTGKENNPYDVQITCKDILKVEWWDTILSLKEFLWNETVIRWRIDSNHAVSSVKRLTAVKAPEILIENARKYSEITVNRIDKIFELYWTGFITIELGVNSSRIPKWEWMRLVELNGKSLIIDNVNILDKQWNIIEEKELNISDAAYTSEGPKIKIHTDHAYSVEKCYIDKNWEKRVWVVNPRHTDIKFDMSLEQCKNIFVRDFWVVNIDNLLREEQNNNKKADH